MPKAAVFSADYYNFEYKKGLKVCRLVFEVPYEHAGLVRDVLGDPPLGGAQVRVAIARLHDAPSGATKDGPDASVKAGPPDQTSMRTSAQDQDTRRTFSSLPRSQQAGIKCGDDDFRRWIEDAYTKDWNAVWEEAQPNSVACDKTLKNILAIKSKRELDTDHTAAARWDSLLTDFSVRGIVR